MVNGWPVVPIAELYEGLYDGPHATPKPADEGPVFLGIKNVTDDGRLDLSDIRHIAEEDFARWTKRVEPRPGDLVFTYEATLNRYAVIPEGFRGCLGRRMALIRPDPKRVDVRFLHFYFFTPAWRSVIRENTLSGATVDRIPLTRFPTFPVHVPPLSVQHRIASILAAYDDLIENCELRIRLLDEMVRALYREWFVLCRYPGQEEKDIARQVAMKDVTTLITKGTTPTTLGRSFVEDGVSFVKAESIAEDGRLRQEKLAYIDSDTHELLGRSQLQVNDLLFSIAGVIGRTLRVDRRLIPGNTNQAVAIVRPDDRQVDPGFLYYTLRSEAFQRHSLGRVVQTAQANVSLGVLSAAPLALPPIEHQRAFASLADPIREASLVLENQSDNLRKTRDLLLPRLFSGQLNVSGSV